MATNSSIGARAAACKKPATRPKYRFASAPEVLARRTIGEKPTARFLPRSLPCPPPMFPRRLAPLPQELKSALKAFRKRLKLTQLDDQSRLGYGPMTGGQQSSIVAITPPDQFPAAVWEELARQGKLKRAGSGTYALGQP